MLLGIADSVSRQPRCGVERLLAVLGLCMRCSCMLARAGAQACSRARCSGRVDECFGLLMCARVTREH
eukprot:13946325-Alexandrium_andersonii.AAC.1